MKLVPCANCGQSINPKRDVCPFCNTPVVKDGRAPSRAIPVSAQPASPDSHNGPDAAGDSQAVTIVAQPPWWKRPKVIIPVAAAIIALVVVLAVAVPRYQASQEKKAAKEAAATAVAPFVKLDSAMGVGANFQDYTRMVRDAQYALNDYKPAKKDHLGFFVRTNLTIALMQYQSALDKWNSGFDSQYGTDLVMPDMQKLWDDASKQVTQAKGWIDNGLPPSFEKLDLNATSAPTN